ncbi:MAG: TolC family protein [Deltaproteobacteria bacterium]|jgi:outer membrane protein TolC|nr:TolC family protein [Deltaproteobacteria bacterium]
MRRREFPGTLRRAPATAVLLGLLAAAVILAGCADPVRQTAGRPFIAVPIEPSTIYGEATIGEGRSREAIDSLEVPGLPHSGPLTLEDCVELAARVNPNIDSTDQGYLGAMWSRWQAITDFLPSVGMSYGPTRYNDATATGSRDQWSWGTEVQVPIFTGGRTVAGYLLGQLGLSEADINRVRAKEDLVLAVKQAYYGILAAEKALDVAKTTVVNLQSHLNVARNFYDVGMVPQNQVLEAEVELARAQLQETNRGRELNIAISKLNVLLRRPMGLPLSLKDELSQPRFPMTLDDCLLTGLKDNPEVQLGRNQVEIRTKSVDVARSALYPTVTVNYTNNSTGTTGNVSANNQWRMSATANFNVWEWGRARAGVEINKVTLNQAIDNLMALEDNTKLEINTNFLNLVSAASNISVSLKAVELARENLRMVSERYQVQVATNTEVMDAQTLFSTAQYDYYQALYDYNLSWAAIERSMGRSVTTAGLVPLSRPVGTPGSSLIPPEPVVVSQ